MDIMIVCGSPGPGGPEYALGVALGLILDLFLCAQQRYLARRSAIRRILPLR